MNNYIKLLDIQQNYETYIGKDPTLPNVSFVQDNPDLRPHDDFFEEKE